MTLSGRAALVAAAYWYAASNRRIRRISYHEDLNAKDLNRLIVALNRTQILNARAASAASISGIAVSLRLLLDAFAK